MIARLIVIAAALGVAAPEPAGRMPALLPLRVASPFAHISAVRELPDGRLLVTDASMPAVFVLAPTTGVATRLGSAGVGTDQYVQPGGLYGGPDRSTLLLDRAQKRVMVISATGTFTRTYSIAIRGVQSSSDADIDREKLDAKGLSYFIDVQGHMRAKMSGAKVDSADLVRFDAVTQHAEPVAHLLQPDERITPGGDGITYGQRVIGSPADGWGVTPDGRVAVVRAAPYRVEWYSATGAVTRGPALDYTAIPMTEDDRRAFAAANKGSVSVGMSGGNRAAGAGVGPLFAPNKPPFDPDDVVVSPDGHVWVQRTRPFGVREITYDVFDGTGARIDRIEFPPMSRVVGFGAAAVYVREGDGAGPIALKKYKGR